MKKLAIPLLAICAAAIFGGCRYEPTTVYTYWRFSVETGTYSPVRTEYPISADEQRELGVVETLPQDAKTTEPQ
ncbi:MAG: hypothetical protein LUD39_04700 [Opitutae bacterium]|nr:hypothetical protein [Opitutae bacterium]MCD8299039.1 hypothetical protein [Opitutae bacterium]